MNKFTTNDLRILRQSRGMKQNVVARKMGISTQRYAELKNNDCRPSNRTLEILTALGFTEESALKFLDALPFICDPLAD